MVGRALLGRGPGAAGRRMDDCRRLQPSSFDPVTDTVSTLAAVGAVSRWLMTLTFLVVGTCDVITGPALRPAGVPASGSTDYLPSSKYRTT